jgi:hypothetical protein
MLLLYLPSCDKPKGMPAFEEFSKSLVEPGVSEFAAGKLAIDPGLGLGSSGVINLA